MDLIGIVLPSSEQGSRGGERGGGQIMSAHWWERTSGGDN